MADNPPTAPASSGQGRGGGRRRGRGGAPPTGRADGQRNTGDGASKGNKSRGRGGRGSGGRDKQQGVDESKEAKSHTPVATATVQAKEGPAAADDADDVDDGEICFICASNVEHTSVSPCNHRTCHICALRLRALYKNKSCAHCRTESAFVIFTDDPVKRFEDFEKKEFARTDDNLGIHYEKDEIFEDTVLLLRYNCPDEDCDVACLGWPDLHRHVKSKHGKVMCDLCTRNKKVFTHEHTLFTTAELRKHEKYGDHKPGAIDQSGFKGHPECGFCRQRFYGDDELYAHCRDKHERCHICDRRSSNRQQQYYIDYNALEGHFQKDHFLCLDKECLEKKFVVFDSKMDLKAHQLEAHPEGVSKDVRRDARMVDLAEFDIRTPYQPQRQRRGAGRGRDPNAEPLPVSSAQQLGRAEQAFQRQQAIQSAQSVTTRSFGGQLTRNETQTVQAPARSAAATPVPSSLRSQPPPTSELESLSLAVSSEPLSLQDQARRLRHSAVVERASNLLRNDTAKMNEFRSRVSSFRSSAIGPTELIDAFFVLFDTSSAELGKLIKELADIYEDESKRNSLLQAWNDWRAINEDYPALPGPGGLLPGMSPATVSTGGKRVLRLKSSTAQSSRSSVGRSGALSSSSSPSNPFPPLSAAVGSSSRRTPVASATPWAAAPPPPLARPPYSSTPSSSSSAAPVKAARPPTSTADSFPALPVAAKPNVMMAGKTRGYVRWDERKGPAPSAWGSNSSSGIASPAEPVDADFEDTSEGKRGKKKKGKQTLFHFG